MSSGPAPAPPMGGGEVSGHRPGERTREPMTSRLLASLFRPATALVGRLRYAQTFVVVGLVLLVPLGLVAYAYVAQQRAQIDFSARERQGVTMLAPLITLTADTVRARHAAAAGGRVVNLDPDLAAVDA